MPVFDVSFFSIIHIFAYLVSKICIPSYFLQENYLMEFGYLPKSSIETGNLRTEEQFKESLKKLQANANIPVTGLIDENTIQLMKKKRCGLPDDPQTPGFYATDGNLSRRSKRYVIQGPKWSKTDITWRYLHFNIFGFFSSRAVRCRYLNMIQS